MQENGGWGKTSKRIYLHGHVDKTAVQIGVRFELPRGEILVLESELVNFEGDGQEIAIDGDVVFELVQHPGQLVSRAEEFWCTISLLGDGLNLD